MGDILYAMAYTIDKQLVFAKDAEKGIDYFCPSCGQPMILNKKEVNGKKRPYFSHKVLNPHCTQESALHYSFKNILFNKIKTSIMNKTPLKFSWKCIYCSEIHEGDLIRKATDVQLEYNLGVCRPDIALIDKKGKVYAVIEIVVTHDIEEQSLKYYNDNKIMIMKCYVKTDMGLDILRKDVFNISYVDYCSIPKCKKCGFYLHKKTMIIIDGECWKCKSNMRLAALNVKGSYLSTDEFTLEDIAFAKTKGINITKKYSGTINRKYLANTCIKCNSFIGEHYLFDEFANVYGVGSNCETYDRGYYCSHCY